MVHNPEDALELAQETFVRAFENLGSFERAEEAYKTALRVEPGSIGASTNLAALYERRKLIRCACSEIPHFVGDD